MTKIKALYFYLRDCWFSCLLVGIVGLGITVLRDSVVMDSEYICIPPVPYSLESRPSKQGQDAPPSGSFTRVLAMRLAVYSTLEVPPT